MIIPLRKTQLDKSPYKRLPETEAKLAELASLSEERLLRKCKIRDREDPDFVSSECVLYFVRARRFDAPNRTFELLYKVLLERVLVQLPDPKRIGKKADKATAVGIREDVLSRFALLLASDREEYEERLDIYEIRFAFAVARLRSNVAKKVYLEANRTGSLDGLSESGALSPSEESRLESEDSIDFTQFGDKNDRTRYFAAINHLPDNERTVVEMLRQGFPFESEDPNAVTISRTLDRTPKTARKYRDKAIATLRELLAEDEV